jgi:predicted xylose isomerase-like sugar epimerase
MTDISDKAVQEALDEVQTVLECHAQTGCNGPIGFDAFAVIRARIEADAKVIEAAEQAVAVVEDKVTTFDAGYKATFGERGLPTDWQNTSMTLPLAPFDDLRRALAARKQVNR